MTNITKLTLSFPTVGNLGALFFVSIQNNMDPAMELVYQRMTGKAATDDPQYQLKRWPMEMIQWPVHNSDRWDVEFSKDWSRVQQQPVLDRALPADEAFLWSDFLTEGSTCGAPLHVVDRGAPENGCGVEPRGWGG